MKFDGDELLMIEAALKERKSAAPLERKFVASALKKIREFNAAAGAEIKAGKYAAVSAALVNTSAAGAKTSEAKKAAAKLNGAKGGRPRKNPEAKK